MSTHFHATQHHIMVVCFQFNTIITVFTSCFTPYDIYFYFLFTPYYACFIQKADEEEAVSGFK